MALLDVHSLVVSILIILCVIYNIEFLSHITKTFIHNVIICQIYPSLPSLVIENQALVNFTDIRRIDQAHPLSLNMPRLVGRVY